MKKFYIPTSSLNFNNILSTESVSPKAFYECRKFGYGRWTSIPENSCDFVVTLYDHPGMFARTQSDLEDHPLLIEYSTDEEFKKVGDGIHVSDHTLYFNPAITRFIFFTEQDRKVALSLTESSLETKLVSVYKQRIIVETFEKQYAPIGIHELNAVNEIEIEKDRMINRMKGLLYGYYVGASLLSKPDQVKRLSAYLKIQNIFAAIVSSDSRMPTESQQEQLKLIFAELNRFDPLYKALLEFESEAARVDQLLVILQKFGKNILSEDVEALVKSLKDETTESCHGVCWVKNKILGIQDEMKSNQVYLSPEKDEIIILDGKLDKVANECLGDKQMQELFKAWVNDVFTKPEFNGRVSSCKEGLADALTYKAKEVLDSEWVDGNPIRQYMNAMRKHIIGKNEFNEEWNNDLLSSMTAVLSKGDDWDGMLRFMQGKGLTDYRLAFAMYGELNGFANLTRDFTDIVLSGQNKNRRAMYQEFYGQLHDKQIDWSMLDDPPQSLSDDETFKAKVLRFFHSSKFEYRDKESKKQSLLSGLLSVFEQLTDNPDPIVFIQALAERKGVWSDNNKPWNIMQKEFAPGYVKHGKVAMEENQSNDNNAQGLLDITMEEKKTKLMLDDAAKWVGVCAEMIDDAKARLTFEGDAYWFVNNHQDQYTDNVKGVVPGYYCQKEKSNAATIDRYDKHLKRKLNQSNQDNQWLVDAFKKVPIEKIIRYLRGAYV